MSGLNFNNINYQAKQRLINKNYHQIYAHELAHKNAGGSLAGSIVIEKNSEGIPVSGHVSIRMPKLNKQNPDETITQADIVLRAALAPADPSTQDYRVANQAKSIKSQAKTLKEKKHLDYYA